MGQANTLNLQSLFTNSRLGINLALALGRMVPPRLGYPLVGWVADLIAGRRNWEIVKGARVNQWVVSQGQLSGRELDRAVHETFRSQARALYDYYRHLNEMPEQQMLIRFEPAIEQLIASTQQPNSGRGTVVVGIHMASFDFAYHIVFRKGLRALAITLAEITGGHQQQFDMRRNENVELVTASMASMRQAVARLESGGYVLTGIDRPIPNAKYRPRFFGYPAELPVFHIFLALKARVPVRLAALVRQEDGTYRVLLSDPIEMQPYPDRQTEILCNAEAVLSVAETFIRQAPHQWAMFFPVWPDLMDRVPKT